MEPEKSAALAAGPVPAKRSRYKNQAATRSISLELFGFN